MKADRNIVYDGQNYKEGEEIWDLGSFECIDVGEISVITRDYLLTLLLNFRSMTISVQVQAQDALTLAIITNTMHLQKHGINSREE